jgi:hypothetical protein
MDAISKDSGNSVHYPEGPFLGILTGDSASARDRKEIPKWISEDRSSIPCAKPAV